MNDTTNEPDPSKVIAYVITEEGVYTQGVRVATTRDAAIAVAVEMARNERNPSGGKPDGYHRYAIHAHHVGGGIVWVGIVQSERSSKQVGYRGNLTGRIMLYPIASDAPVAAVHVGDHQ